MGNSQKKTAAGTVVWETVRVSNRPGRDARGCRDYRTVYACREAAALYADITGRCSGTCRRQQEVTVTLFRMEAGKAECMARQQVAEIEERPDGTCCVSAGFTADGGEFAEGIYVVVAENGGQTVQSEPLSLLGGDGRAASYFRPVNVAVDKCCEESEMTAKARKHSFRCLDIRGLLGVRFCLLAENLLDREWVYEFTVQVTEKNGWVKCRYTERGDEYVKTADGKFFLCFTTCPGEGIAGFWQEGDYRLDVYAFGGPVLSLGFTIGREEVPYSYLSELKAALAAEPALPAREKKQAGSEEILDRLYRLAGLRKVKEAVTRLDEYAAFLRMRQKNGFEDTVPSWHMVFTGCPDTGVRAVAGIVGELLACYGFLPHGRVCFYRRENLLRTEGSAAEQNVRGALAEADGGVLLIGWGGDLYSGEEGDDPGKEALEVLLEILRKERPAIAVILAGTEEETGILQQVFPQMREIFGRQLYFEAYKAEEWLEIVGRKLEKRQFGLSRTAKDKLLKLLQQYVNRGEASGEKIDREIGRMILKMSRRLMNRKQHTFSREEMMSVTEADIDEEQPVSAFPLEKLDKLVGARRLKQSIVHHLNYVSFLQERRRQGLGEALPPLHMIFAGNPGTGKQTVAKMMGEIYYAAGILEKPVVVIQSAALLAADGLPPRQMAEALFGAARGGVLYVGEAELLLKSPAGTACFEFLLSCLSPEEHLDTVVVLAASAEGAGRMLQENPVLEAYFPYRFDFKDYTRQELMEIVIRKLKDRQYDLHPKAARAFRELIAKTYATRESNCGNAVWMQKLVDAAIRRMSDRIMRAKGTKTLTRKELLTLMPADVPVDYRHLPGMRKDLFDEKEIKKALDELQQLVGQKQAKKQIQDFVGLARHYAREGIKLSSRMSLQWCFTGNSGMGKKAVARILARLYKAMGIIERDTVFGFNAGSLFGQTEEAALQSVGEALAKAEGGILLFDEDSRKLAEIPGMRERIRAVLAAQMAERPGSCMVIYAGPEPMAGKYRQEVEKAADMANVLCFEDYTPEELMLMLRRKLADEHLQMTASARKYMAGFLTALTATGERSRISARILRVTAELMVRNTVRRLSAKGKVAAEGTEKFSVVKADVEMFTEDWLDTWMTGRRKIGFR